MKRLSKQTSGVNKDGLQWTGYDARHVKLSAACHKFSPGIGGWGGGTVVRVVVRDAVGGAVLA